VQDIFLGAKRPQRPGRLRRRLALGGAAVAALLVLGTVAFRRATSAQAPSGSAPGASLGTDGNRLTLGASSLEHSGDLWVLRLAGEPYALGYAEARLLGRSLGDGASALDVAILGEDPPAGVGGFFRDLGLRWRHRLLADGLAPARRLELAGLAAGWAAAGLPAAPSYQRLVWREAALDGGHAPGSLAPIGGVATGLAFVVGGAAPLGHTVVGRTFAVGDPPGPGPLVVSFITPAPDAGGERLAFARVGWAGDVGVVTGVNAASVVVCVDPAVTEDVRAGAAAPPVTHVAREVLERAHDLDEAVTLLQAARPLGSASFLVVDGKAGTWAVVERTPTKVSVTRPRRAVAIGDALGAPDFTKDAENDRARRTRPGMARLGRVEELLARGVSADAAGVAQVLRDRHGRGDTRLPVGNGNAIDTLAAAHVAIVDATALTLWVAEGPGASGALRAFDLRHELLGEPPRAGVHGALAADAGADPAAARAVALGQLENAAAERDLRAGHTAAAAEHVVRALALAPELAEAHRSAGDVAREQGDATAAAEHYRRYLDLAPADPGAEGEVRAFLGGP
jgi:hypothetical protein